MTYLDTDKQTQADLSITEGIYDEYPLYSLFSGTETKNGKRMMLDWITSPLNDISAIRKRQEAIAWKELPELPLDEEEVSIRPRACFSPSYNKVKSQTKHVWLLTLL